MVLTSLLSRAFIATLTTGLSVESQCGGIFQLSSKFRALLQDCVVEISTEATRNPHQRGFVSRGKALEVAFFPGARES
jgi:hypothetical protein